MARELSPYQVIQDKIKSDFLAAKEAGPISEQTFSRFLAEATGVLAGYGDQNQADNAALCALILKGWEPEDSVAFMSEFDLPGRVYVNMSLAEIPLPAWLQDQPKTEETA